jgi:hypothetical protein
MLFGLLVIATYVAGVANQYRFVAYAAMFALGPLLAFAKKRITVPRMGSVEFGATRKARKRHLVVFLTLLAALTLALLAATIGGAAWIRVNHVGVSLGIGFGVFVAFAAVAFWLDLARMYWVGLLVGAAITATELLDDPLPLLVAGSVVALGGLAQLTLFLQRYPRPAGGLGNGTR